MNMFSKTNTKKRTAWNKGMVGFQKGRKFSDEHRLKISLALKGNKNGKNHTVSEQNKIKLSLAKKGKSVSEEIRKKISLASIGVKKRERTVEHRQKLSKMQKEKYNLGLSNIGLKGSNNPRWVADRNKLKRYSGSEERRSPAYQHWRKEVWLRDKCTCKIANPDCSGRIEVHHILGWTEYPELRYQVNNGITLCHAHHPRKRAEEKRLVPTFQELVSVSSN